MNHRSRAVTGGSWRVAVGGNRVQNMTPEEIARAFRAGQLNERTPLWPPGTSGWQALGNFEQFRMTPASMPPSAANPMPAGSPYAPGPGPNTGSYGGPARPVPQGPGPQTPPAQGSLGMANTMAGVGQLSSYDEEEDDPTRMWTGDDPAMMPSPGAPPGPQPSSSMARPNVPAHQGSPYVGGESAQHSAAAPGPGLPAPPPSTVGASVPQPAPAAAPPPQAMRAPVAPAAASPAAPPGRSAQANVAFRPPEERRGGGMTLVVGVVGLGLLGAAIFALKGGDDSPQEGAKQDTVATAPMAVKPADKKPPTAAEQDKPEPTTTVEASALKEASPNPENKDSAESLQAKSLAPQDEKSKATGDEENNAEDAKADSSSKDDEQAAELSAKEKRKARRIAARKRRLANEKKRERQRARAAAAEAPSSRKAPAKAKVSPRKAPSSRPTTSAAVQKNASKALEASSKLARSCRPKGGPSGPGKVRVTYNQDGSVKGVEMLTARFRETLTGGCVRMVFRRAKIKAFKGTAPPFIKGFTIPDQ